MADSEGLYRALVRVLTLAFGLWLLVKFVAAVELVILLFLLALILFMAANPLVTMFERKHVPRVVTALLVPIVGLVVLAGLVLLVAPQFASQFDDLAANLPNYVQAIRERVAGLLDRYPGVAAWLEKQGRQDPSALRRIPSLLARLGGYTLGLVSALVFAVILATVIIYMLAQPRPLLKGYLSIFPEPLRDPAATAFARAQKMVGGWVRSNLIVGGLEGVVAAAFLMIMGIPGALVWAVLTFFSELIPKIGPYLMTIPPVLLALTISPLTALWVLLFYVALQELAGDLVAPKVRGAEMNLHPVSIMFGVLAMTIAFGFIGAVVATPVVGMVKVAYEEFYLKRHVNTRALEPRVELMLRGEAGD